MLSLPIPGFQCIEIYSLSGMQHCTIHVDTPEIFHVITYDQAFDIIMHYDLFCYHDVFLEGSSRVQRWRIPEEVETE